MTVGKLWAKADSRRRMGGGKFIIVLRTSRNTEVNNNHANTRISEAVWFDTRTYDSRFRWHSCELTVDTQDEGAKENELKRRKLAQRGTHTRRSRNRTKSGA